MPKFYEEVVDKLHPSNSCSEKTKCAPIIHVCYKFSINIAGRVGVANHACNQDDVLSAVLCTIAYSAC